MTNTKSNGVYSLFNGWLKVPEKSNVPDINNEEIKNLIKPYIDRFNSAKSFDELQSIEDDIYTLRQKGLLNGGEYSDENLAFKEFRNQGYLSKIKDKKVEFENKEMSLEGLEECDMSMDNLDEALLLEANLDKQRFIDKFGQEAFDQFNSQSIKQKLKNMQISVDLSWHVKNTTPEQMADILKQATEVKSNKDTRKEAKRGAAYIQGNENWDVYYIGTYEAAKYYGSNTCWCITGRYSGFEGDASGRRFFTDYLRERYTCYLLYINKHPTDINIDGKYMVCPMKRSASNSSRVEIWGPQDQTVYSLPGTAGLNFSGTVTYTTEAGMERTAKVNLPSIDSDDVWVVEGDSITGLIRNRASGSTLTINNKINRVRRQGLDGYRIYGKLVVEAGEGTFTFEPMSCTDLDGEVFLDLYRNANFGRGAFMGSQGLLSLEIEKGVSITLGEGALYDTSLAEILLYPGASISGDTNHVLDDDHKITVRVSDDHTEDDPSIQYLKSLSDNFEFVSM